MAPEDTVKPAETVLHPSTSVFAPKPAAPPREHAPSSVQKLIAALPRHNHALLGQSMVGSQMVAHADGEWIRREDVLKLL